MLGKLFKYDFKGVSKVMGLLALVMAIYAFFAACMLQTPIYSGLFSGNSSSEEMTVFGGVSGLFGFFAFIVILVSVNLGGIIYLGVRFFKSMYDDEGYLTHTLPATAWERLLSKVISGTLWIFIIRLVVAVSVGIIFVSFVILALRQGVSLKEVKDRLYDIMTFSFIPYSDYVETFMNVSIHAVIYGIFYILLSPFIDVVHVFGALSIGQCFKKNRGFLGVVMYFVISWGTSFVLMIVKGVSQVSALAKINAMDAVGMGGYLNKTFFLNYDLELIVTFVISIVLVYISHNIIEKKLNLI